MTARRSVVRLDGDARRAGFTAKEETLTDLLLARMAQHAQVDVFTRHQESHDTGADWLWWFHQGDDWFGLLVQAKRVTFASNHKPTYAFDARPDRPGATSQRDTLLAAAGRLRVPAAYVLYNGSGLPRSFGGSCGCPDVDEPLRTRMGVSVVPALLVDYLVRVGFEVTPRSAPLECLVCSPTLFRPSPWIPPGSTREVVEFLRGKRQTLPRSVAGSLADSLLHVRMGQLRAAQADVDLSFWRSEDADEWLPVFTEVSGDLGHFSEPYLRHVLRGLRAQPPGYLASVERVGGDDLLSDMPGNVAGVVLVTQHTDRGDETSRPDQNTRGTAGPEPTAIEGTRGD